MLKYNIDMIYYIQKCENGNNIVLTLHVPDQSVLVGQSVIRPLLPEGDLDTVLHLHVIDLGKASYEEIHHYQSGII